MWPCYKQTKFDGQIKKARFCAKHRETVHMPIIVPAKLKFVFLGLRPHLRASTGTRRVKIPEICFHSTLLLISFRMIPHMPRVKLKFILFFSLLTPVSINAHVVTPNF